jgi:hypothetical protein
VSGLIWVVVRHCASWPWAWFVPRQTVKITQALVIGHMSKWFVRYRTKLRHGGCRSRVPPPSLGWTVTAVNHLGHFALAVGLHLALAAAQGARVISVRAAEDP